jgi:hypothetical protein
MLEDYEDTSARIFFMCFLFFCLYLKEVFLLNLVAYFGKAVWTRVNFVASD